MGARVRPEIVAGITEKIKVGCGSLYVTVNSEAGVPFEVFLQLGKGGGCAASQVEAVGRLVSYALRVGGSVKDIIKHLRGIRCASPVWSNGVQITSCADAVAVVLGRVVGVEKEDKKTEIAKGIEVKGV